MLDRDLPIPPTCGFAEFDLNVTARELTRHGYPCHLEPKTFDLLTYLIAHRDRVVGRSELFDSLWPRTTVCDGALSQCVSSLRRALGDTGRGQRCIRTYNRIGYRFVLPLDARRTKRPSGERGFGPTAAYEVV